MFKQRFYSIYICLRFEPFDKAQDKLRWDELCSRLRSNLKQEKLEPNFMIKILILYNIFLKIPSEFDTANLNA